MDLDNFIVGKTKERREEERFGKKSNNCLPNIEQQLMAKIAKNRLLPHGWKAQVDPPSNSCLTNIYIYMLTVNKNREKNSRVQRI